MGLWQIVIPQSAKNLITNPSPYVNTAGYAVGGGSLFRDATKTRRGIASFQYVPSSGVNDGFYFSLSLTSGSAYSFTVDIFGANGIPYKVWFSDNSGNQVGTATSLTGIGDWSQQVVSYTAGSSATFRVNVSKNNSANTSTFWGDGFMVQTSGSGSTYVDGQQPGCSWDGAQYNSTSTRDGQSREGGIATDFDTYNLLVNKWDGIGMAQVQNVILRYGLQDGGYYQRTKALPRAFALAARVNTVPGQANPSLDTLLTNRKAFIDAIKPDLVSNQQPFWLRYMGGTKPMWIKALYDSGMELKYQGGTDGFSEAPSPKLVCPDPYWTSDGIRAFTSSGSQILTNTNRIAKRGPDGTWAALGTGMNNSVNALVVGPDGSLYAGGAFTTAGGVTVNGVAKWDGVNWNALTSGGSPGVAGGGSPQVLALAVAADGTLYVGGNFTTAGSTTVNNIAKWNGLTWSTVPTSGSVGMNGTVRALAIGFDGTVYAGGAFTTSGSITTNRTAQFAGTAWAAMGSGANNTVNGITIGMDGFAYFGGAFTTPFGEVAQWNGSAWVNILGGASFNNTVDTLATGLDGSIYAGGLFTTPGAKVAKWNGAMWTALGTGLTNGQVDDILQLPNGLIYFAGTFTAAGGMTLPDALAVWNGNSWAFADIDLPDAPTEVTALASWQGTLYAGWLMGGGGSTSAVSAITSVTNAGTAIARPILTFTGPGTVYQVANYTTGDVIYFNLTLQTGETATLDLTPGKISFISSFRGNILGAILPGSVLSTFKLLPGTNSISVFGSIGSNSVVVQWRERFWSVDGGA